jgi:hypothetical protein
LIVLTAVTPAANPLISPPAPGALNISSAGNTPTAGMDGTSTLESILTPTPMAATSTPAPTPISNVLPSLLPSDSPFVAGSMTTLPSALPSAQTSPTITSAMMSTSIPDARSPPTATATAAPTPVAAASIALTPTPAPATAPVTATVTATSVASPQLQPAQLTSPTTSYTGGSNNIASALAVATEFAPDFDEDEPPLTVTARRPIGTVSFPLTSSVNSSISSTGTLAASLSRSSSLATTQPRPLVNVSSMSPRSQASLIAASVPDSPSASRFAANMSILREEKRRPTSSSGRSVSWENPSTRPSSSAIAAARAIHDATAVDSLAPTPLAAASRVSSLPSTTSSTTSGSTPASEIKGVPVFIPRLPFGLRGGEFEREFSYTDPSYAEPVAVQPPPPQVDPAEQLAATLAATLRRPSTATDRPSSAQARTPRGFPKEAEKPPNQFASMLESGKFGKVPFSERIARYV